MKKIVILGILLILSIAVILSGENKTALIIANGSYRHFQTLSNPTREAVSMKNALEHIGFEVTILLDGTYDQMYNAMNIFEQNLRQRGGIGFFLYGGHGVQVGGENYLLPIDKQIPDEGRVKSRAVHVGEIVELMKAANTSSNIIILDACRDNPLPASSRSTDSRGLARLDAPVNSIVVYSAEAGKTAEDGVFTPILIEHISTPGLDINEILMRVRREVYDRTGGKQIPGEYSQLFEPIYLAGLPSGKPAPSREKSEIGMVPTGFVFIEAGTFTMGSPAGEPNRNNNENEHTVEITQSFYISKFEVSQSEYREIMGTNPSDRRYRIGEDYPVNKVNWYSALEYCNRLSQRNGFNPCYSGSGENIMCDFSRNGYRLPTEAEWEYAARGGNESRGYIYAGSNNINAVGWSKENSGYNIHAPGLKQANELGIFDMSGNVWEWCWDLYGNYPAGRVTDPTGPASGSYRVFRGGSWFYDSGSSRAASRLYSHPTYGYDNVGFRVVRTAQ